MIHYRKMRSEDSESVEQLYQECFSNPWSLKSVQEMFTVDGYCSLVAVDEEQHIVGYIGMKSVFDEADITNVAVDTRFRGRGIAHELLSELLVIAAESGLASIFLEVRVSNSPAITLYEHAGFKECGLRRNYYSKPDEDALLMVWNH